MLNKRNFCFIIASRNFATLENQLTYQCPSSWPVVITIKEEISRHLQKNYRILAGPNEWQQVCNRSNPGKTGRSCGEADFSLKVSWTLGQTRLKTPICCVRVPVFCVAKWRSSPRLVGQTNGWVAWMRFCQAEQVIMDELREDGARSLCIMATSPSPCAHNERSSFSCFADRSSCPSTQESDSQGHEQEF